MNGVKSFSKGEAIAFGWQTMRSNFGFFVGLLIAFGLLFYIPYLLATMALRANVFLGVILIIVDIALTIIISMGLVKIVLRFCDGERGKLSDLFSQYRLFWKYFFAGLSYLVIIWGAIVLFFAFGTILAINSLIIVAGILLLMVPTTIILGIRFWFFDYFIVDKKAGAVESLKKSYALTRGSGWNLFLFFLMVGGINLLGALALLVGLFATIPTTMVASAFVYRKLLAQTEPETVPVTSAPIPPTPLPPVGASY